ncbi:sensor histidine kinase [Synoicihabitans lomoniglobus]|uniref:Histidine kinase n=1 Tax=Synoicihabitans lomoniglobus TaxID=2909285 RepID=A0AAF0CN50_9BACT|nr:histidine kinase [Opitutaceae bacterium LMO-M01]WED64161.1 histidine kinase [Opitutaceae bacterium LMO-M01]
MIDSAPPFTDPVVAAKRERAKGRLYVMCQTIGWLGFLAMQLIFVHIVQSGKERAVSVSDDAQIVMIALLGWLISHYARVYFERWGWKEMGWLKLLPRALIMTFLMSLVWSIVGYGWSYGVLQETFPDKINPFLLMCISVINGTFVFGAWMSFYFVYHVFDRFNRSEIERLRLATVVKDAELRALKSQVNPHFMFNSLNSVRALIDEDPSRAREAVTQLANMLRYSLQAGSKQTVSFEDELTVVNDYLALEQVRHEERLRLRLDVDPDTLRRSIPPMLLQTLVENAVKYGIATQPAGGEIAIVARIRDGDLRIAVCNPGNLRSATAQESSRSTGVGLRNASDRLQLLFGDSATLTVSQSGPGEVTAEVVVPQDADRELAAPDRRRAARPSASVTPKVSA